MTFRESLGNISGAYIPISIKKDKYCMFQECRSKDKNKDMNINGGLYGKKTTKRWPGRESKRGDYDQSTLCAYVNNKTHLKIARK